MTSTPPPEVQAAPGYSGGWFAPIVCSGGGTHAFVPQGYGYEHEVSGVAVRWHPLLVVRPTRRSFAAGVPGRSNVSDRLRCTLCARTPSVDPDRLGGILQRARDTDAPYLDSSRF